MVQNLVWSVLYLRNTLSSALLQKVMTLFLITSTVPEFYVSIMTTFIYYLYVALESHFNSIKLKSFLRDNFTHFCAVILASTEYLDTYRELKHENFGYITRIFEDTSDYRFFFGKFRSTSRLRSSLINFMCMNWISYNKRIS